MEIRRLSVTSLIAVLFPLLVYSQPVADFNVNVSSGCSPMIVSFIDASSPDVVRWKWNLGTSVSNLKNPGAFYQNAGQYDISLIVFDAQGSSDTLIRQAYIEVFGNPTAQFNVNNVNACANELLSFTDISSPGSGQITQWTWDLGNGSTSNLANPQIRYQASGVYPVSLNVTNQHGCQDDIIINNYITVNAPDVSFSGDELLACGPPLLVQFSSDGTTSGQHFWDFGDGNSSTQVDPSHTYTQNGSFDVRHIIQDSQGCRDTLVKDAYINIGVNTLSIYAQDSSVCIRDTVFLFTNAASNSQVVWDFGDGTNDSTQNPFHLFANPGNYQVIASISDQ
ncbi:MAG: PKD domain-containing protein, partial [Bacteroidia bacterium]